MAGQFKLDEISKLESLLEAWLWDDQDMHYVEIHPGRAMNSDKLFVIRLIEEDVAITKVESHSILGGLREALTNMLGGIN